jgi:hypothetical protein
MYKQNCFYANQADFDYIRYLKNQLSKLKLKRINVHILRVDT